jgi:hypothetical protein
MPENSKALQWKINWDNILKRSLTAYNEKYFELSAVNP